LKPSDKFIVCYVTDRLSLDVAPGQNREAALTQRIENALRAGIRWLQIREKDLPARKLIGITRVVLQTCSDLAIRDEARILVNDRCDVAWAAGAAGVHLGEKSLPVRMLVKARHARGLAQFLVGASCHSAEGAIKAADEGADYIFFGPIFATPSKAGLGAPQGLAKLAQVCGTVPIPVIAIGGITIENARACRETGAAGIAAIRLFQQKVDLAEIVANLMTK
jgi:thiamine-phosphate pyrophosphorylase